MSILDIVQQQLGAGGTQQMANQIGADPSTTQNAIQAAIPMILGGMAGNARQPGGASAISSALGQGGGGLGGMLGGLMGGGGGGGGGLGGMLGGLLGQHQDTVQQGVQQASGLSGGQTGQLLESLAPMVLGALASQRGGGMGQAMAGAESGGAADLDGNGIPDALEQHARESAQASPAAGGFLSQILGSL